MAKKAASPAKKLRKSSPRQIGEESGLTLSALFALIFESNELLDNRKKLTDEQISLKIKRDFPDCPYGVAKYRGYYNSGKLTGGVPPETPSLRYLPGGIPCNFRGGTRPLLPEEVRSFLTDHSNYRKQVIALRKAKRSA